MLRILFYTIGILLRLMPLVVFYVLLSGYIRDVQKFCTRFNVCAWRIRHVR